MRLLSAIKKNIAVNLFSKLGWELGLYYASYDDFHPDILARMYTRAVRLIEIEIKSRFEIARFLNRFIARFFFFFFFFFFFAPRPNLPQYAIHTNQNTAEQNRPGIQTDSMLKKQGR